MGGMWYGSLSSDAAADEVRALLDQDGLLVNGEPDFTENGRRIFNIEVARFVVNDPSRIASDALTADMAFDLRFDDAMVNAAGAGPEAIQYVTNRTFNWLGSAPNARAQKEAVGKGLVQITTPPLYSSRTGRVEVHKFLTSDPAIIKQYYVVPAATALKKAFLKTNDRAVQVALAVCPGLEDEIGDLLISAVLQGVAQLTPANAGQRVLMHGSKAITAGKTP